MCIVIVDYEVLGSTFVTSQQVDIMLTVELESPYRYHSVITDACLI